MTSELLGIDRKVWNDLLLRGDISEQRLKDDARPLRD
jgi:hypothetical protein